MTPHSEHLPQKPVSTSNSADELALGLTIPTVFRSESHSNRRKAVHAPPGALVAVVEGDQRIVSAAGFADLETTEPMTEQHVHDVASVSKLLTTLTLQRLFSDGEATPQDTLGRFFGPAAGAHAEVTLDELLRHRSGLREWWPLYLEPEPDPITTILSLDPRYPRGRERHYSDLGFQLAGDVLSRITGTAFEDAVTTLLLEPIGATSITAGAPGEGRPVVSGPAGDAIERDMVATDTPYSVGPGVKGAAEQFPWRTHLLRGEIADCNAFYSFAGCAGHAGWFSDATGLLRLAEVLALPEKVGIHPETAIALSTPKNSISARQEQGQGARIYTVDWRGEQRTFLGHPGFTGTFLAAAPPTDTSPEVLTLMLTNRLHSRPTSSREQLTPVDALWRDTMTRADQLLHPGRTGKLQ